MRVWQSGNKWLIEVSLKLNGVWKTIQGIGGKTEEEALWTCSFLEWVYSDEGEDGFSEGRS